MVSERGFVPWFRALYRLSGPMPGDLAAWAMPLSRLKDLLVLNRRQKSTARSQLRLAIEDVLDPSLPRTYDNPLYEQKVTVLFEHVYENYPEGRPSVYQAVAD